MVQSENKFKAGDIVILKDDAFQYSFIQRGDLKHGVCFTVTLYTIEDSGFKALHLLEDSNTFQDGAFRLATHEEINYSKFPDKLLDIIKDD